VSFGKSPEQPIRFKLIGAYLQAPAGGCQQSDIKVTSYVNFGHSAVVVIASWCAGGGTTNVTLDVDWEALGPVTLSTD
jgi:hypothetical protein